MTSELWRESASSLAEKIRRGETSAREVATAFLERIDQVNGDVNAVVEVRPQDVLAEADRADQRQRAGETLGDFHGVPFTVKTNIDVAGYATTQGTLALKDFMATSDAPVVERLRGAGGVMLARTNMPDLGLRINTESSLYGVTHNPWRRGVTAGGSSGGEAAAIASGMSVIGLGNDIGGSLRNPAYACGVASIKPSRGRIPQGNPSSTIDLPLNSQVMLVEGVLGRAVADVRRGLVSLMGAHSGDPQSIDAPLEGVSRPRRVALVAEPFGGTTDPAVAEGVRVAGRALAAAGYEVEEIEPPMLFESYLAWTELMMTSLAVAAPLLVPLLGEGGRRFLELTSVDLGAPTPESLALMHQTRYRVASAWRRFMTNYPLIVGPTWTQPPFPHGFDVESAETAMQVVELFRFVLPANVLGLPAVCVPTGVADGLPTGAQIIGDLFREDLCLNAAEVIEDAVGVLTPIDPRS
ncbi:MAG: indole acetimide hydrolase [Acidobacteriota bacterium]|nr:indole acetimide hydrolase [Acidobacteriota bacterium]MDE3044036.1 indole acetimide hydrolase [Acidobacteriota bacterium]